MRKIDSNLIFLGLYQRLRIWISRLSLSGFTWKKLIFFGCKCSSFKFFQFFHFFFNFSTHAFGLLGTLDGIGSFQNVMIICREQYVWLWEYILLPSVYFSKINLFRNFKNLKAVEKLFSNFILFEHLCKLFTDALQWALGDDSVLCLLNCLANWCNSESKWLVWIQ